GSDQEFTAQLEVGTAYWMKKNGRVKTKADVDSHTTNTTELDIARLSEILDWYNGTKTDHDLAVGFGRGLQAVNIMRNQDEDYEERGVRFIPDGWKRADVFAYARKNLSDADAYLKQIKTKNIKLFCRIPLSLAKRT